MLISRFSHRGVFVACVCLVTAACAGSRTASVAASGMTYSGAPGCIPQPRFVSSTTPIYFEYQVESAARPSVAVPRLARPAGLEQRGGEAVLMFVVDTAGQVEPSTVTVVRSPDPRFSEAACRSLANIPFVPARLGGRPVRVWAQTPFKF